MIKNEWIKIPLDFQIQTGKLVMANQPDIVVTTVVATDTTIPSHCKVREKEHKKLEKYQVADRRSTADVGCEGSSGASSDLELGAVTRSS